MNDVRTLSSEELAREANVSDERIGWLASIGIITPHDPGPYRWPDVFRVKLVGALLDAGFERDVIAKAARDGFLTFQHIDDFGLREPAARSDRSFDAFLSAAGPRASMLPAV